MQPPRRSPRLAEQSAERTVDIEIQQERAAVQEAGTELRTRNQQAMLECAKVMHLPMSPQNLEHRINPSRNDKRSAEPRNRRNDGIKASNENPKYRELYEKYYEKELICLAQGMPGLADGTETKKNIDKNNVPSDRWKDVTYGRIVVT